MKPLKFHEVQEVMDTILHEATFAQDIFTPSIAFTFSRVKNLYGTVYRIFINNKNPHLAQYLYMHECGHIIFSHVKNMKLREDKFLRIKIMGAYNKVENAFGSGEDLFEYFQKTIFNIVMDFEVNSRLFTEEEWNFMNEQVCKLLNTPGKKGMWPKDFGFPEKLTWNEYLNLILMNPKEFVDQLNEFLSRDDGDMELQIPQIMQGGKGKGNGEFSEAAIAKLKKMAEDHGGATFSVPSGEMAGISRDVKGTAGIDFCEFQSQDELIRLIRKYLFARENRNNWRDQMYNLNRRKFNSNVIIPKDRKQIVHRKARLFLLFDVSGSVQPKLVHNLISTFKEFQKEFKNTKIVAWAMELVTEGFIEQDLKMKYGGGTFLAPGIEYIYRTNELKQDDVLFVISDFCDYLEEWKEVLSGMRCKKYAINWKHTVEPVNPGFLKIFKAGKDIWNQ